MAGRLTTHVLDTAQGRPAFSMMMELWRLDAGGDGRKLLKIVRTSADGRTSEPLLQDDEFEAGIYELVFVVGEYFAAEVGSNTAFPFLDRVPVRFGIADPTA